MDKTTIVNNINSFSEAQKAEFNLESSNKIYTVNQTMITNSDKELAIATAEAVNELDSSDISSMNTSLSSSNKLSQRPC